MQRIEVNVQTGEQRVINLTPEETASAQAKTQVLLEQRAANEYQRNRAAKYPSIQEQLDMQYWDAINGTTTWQDAINAVKQEFPKP